MQKIRSKTSQTEDATLCRGGKSFGCQRVIEYSKDSNGDPIRDKGDEKILHPHVAVHPVRCRHCGVYLGCKLCAERPSELVCLACHDWGTKQALQRHGKMVRDPEKIKEAWKLVGIRANAPIPYALSLKQHESPQARQAYLQAAKQADDDIDKLFAQLWAQPDQTRETKSHG